MAGVELGELALDAADVAQPQHGAAADHAAVGFDGVAGERHQRHGEAFAVGAQRIDRALHRLRLVGLEPGAERQHALRRRRVGHQRGVADDVRLVVGRGPGHQDLRLGAQQRVEAVALGAQRAELVARRGFGRGGAACRVRTSMIAVMTANSSTPSVRTRVRFLPVQARKGIDVEREQRSSRATEPADHRPSTADMGRPAPSRPTNADGALRCLFGSVRRGSACRLPLAARTVSGMSRLPLRGRGLALTPTNHWDLTPSGVAPEESRS